MSNTGINTTAKGTLPEFQAKEGHGGWGAMGKIAKDVESVPRPESSLSQQQVLKVHR